MDLQLLQDTLDQAGEPPYRAQQVWRWLVKGADSFDQMSDLPLQLRSLLSSRLPISCLTLQRREQSADRTIKALLYTADKLPVEAVLMRYRDGRRSICLSAQSGCPLTCSFCATGAMPFRRNLTASEILDQAFALWKLAMRSQPKHERSERRASRQASHPDFLGGRPRGRAPVLAAERAHQDEEITSSGEGITSSGEKLTNCVFMGMGEPMLNLDAVLAAAARLPDLGISHRHITISTAGWIPGIEALAEQPLPLRLALSLHAPEDSLRSQLMPINDRHPIREVLAACRRFHLAKRRRVFIEYVMLAGVNDSWQQALQLAQLLQEFSADLSGSSAQPAAGGSSTPHGSSGSSTKPDRSIFKVNLIPYNPTATGSGLSCSSVEAIAAFKSVLLSHHIPVTVRLNRGRDIDAACGQLAARSHHAAFAKAPKAHLGSSTVVGLPAASITSADTAPGRRMM